LKIVQFFYCAIISLHGFLQYARLTKLADAMALLEALLDPSPFETLMDTSRVHADRVAPQPPRAWSVRIWNRE
jgi:hypothetical protein